MVLIFAKAEAEAKARHHAWVTNFAHSFAAVPFGKGFAVAQTDVSEPHYLTNRGFFPVNP